MNLTSRITCKYLCTNVKVSKNIKQILTNIKGERDNNTIIVGTINAPFTSTDRLARQKSI